MSAELAVANLDSLPLSKYGPNDDTMDDMVKGNTFLPRIQFISDQAKLAKTKKFPANHYAFIVKKDEMIDLGDSFTAYPLSYRYKALDFSDPKKVKAHYDPRSAEFISVQEKAKNAPKGEKSPYMYGPEYLLAVTIDGKLQLGTLLCHSASLKGVAKKINGLMNPRVFCTFGHHLVESGDFIYECPNIAKFSGSFDLGDQQKLLKAIGEFSALSGSREEEGDPEVTDANATPAATDSTRAR